MRTRTKTIPVAVAAAALILSACTSSDQPAQTKHEDPMVDSPAIVISKITGEGSENDTDATWDIVGTDLGVMWESASGDMMVAFGDTFGEGWGPPGGNGSNWRSQVLARSSDADLSDGMVLDSAVLGEDGNARELVPSYKIDNVEMTTIPTSGITVGERQYMTYMSVRNWGVPGEWFTNYASIAYSDDDGETWSTEGVPVWDNQEGEGGDNFQMVALVEDDGFVYMIGTQAGRNGPAKIARVPSESLMDKDAYTYWDGAEWSADQDQAVVIVEAPVSELSVQWNEHSQRFLMMYLQGPDIVLRDATDLVGPWGEPQVVAAAVDYPALYGGYIHPRSAGEDLYFLMSQWTPYNVYLMRAQIDQDAHIINPNLIADPSFERHGGTDVEPPWECEGTCEVRMTMLGFMGDRNLVLKPESGHSSVAQEVALASETDYVLRGWFKGNVGSEGTGVGSLRVFDSSGDLIEELSFDITPAAGSRWEQQVLEFNSGRSEGVTIVVEVEGTPAEVDDMSLVRAAEQ